MISRRGILAALIAAPAVIRVAPLMKINSRLIVSATEFVGYFTVSRSLDAGMAFDYRIEEKSPLGGGILTGICGNYKNNAREIVQIGMHDPAKFSLLGPGDRVMIGGREFRVDRAEIAIPLSDMPSIDWCENADHAA